jgi:hypothetical protein
MNKATIPSVNDIEDRRGVVRDEPDDRRYQARERTMLSGVILFPGEETGRAVTIVNRSKQGAKLRVGDVGLLPNTFTLLDQRAGMAHACEVRWRDLPFIGVQFTHSMDLSTEDQKLARQMRSLWEATKKS